MTGKSVCIVTPGYISSTPRVVKEADALSAAGFRVRVVFSQGDLDVIRVFDDELVRTRPWHTTTLRWGRRRRAERLTYWRTTARHHLARQFSGSRWAGDRVALWAEERIAPELARAAAAEPADLYIGHYPAGLAAAAHAASVWKSRLGYDLEDFHAGEHAEPERQLRVERIERSHIHRCAHLTASSMQIGAAVAAHYGIRRPTAIHNTFPLAERERIDGQSRDRRGDGLSLYWFSQTIGLDRGLQDVIRAAGLIDQHVQIHLRGNVSASTRDALLALARSCGVADRLFLHPLTKPTELLSRAAEHDVGLALEQPVDGNKGLTASNKLFVYLLAGLAVAATDLPGQRTIMSSCAAAGRLFTPGDYQQLAGVLARWSSDPRALRSTRAAALAAAQSTWNWETESQKLVASVRAVLP